MVSLFDPERDSSRLAKDKQFNVEIYMEQEKRQNLTEVKCRIYNQVGSYAETVMGSTYFSVLRARDYNLPFHCISINLIYIFSVCQLSSPLMTSRPLHSLFCASLKCFIVCFIHCLLRFFYMSGTVLGNSEQDR